MDAMLAELEELAVKENWEPDEFELACDYLVKMVTCPETPKPEGLDGEKILSVQTLCTTHMLAA